MGLTRRVLLGSGLASGAVVGGSFLACSRGDALAWAPERLHMARASLPDPDAVGVWILARVSSPELTLAIESNPGLTQAMATSCPATRQTLIAQQIRDDYRSGDILLCHRWVLTQTEALIAAVT